MEHTKTASQPDYLYAFYFTLSDVCPSIRSIIYTYYIYMCVKKTQELFVP